MYYHPHHYYPLQHNPDLEDITLVEITQLPCIYFGGGSFWWNVCMHTLCLLACEVRATEGN